MLVFMNGTAHTAVKMAASITIIIIIIIIDNL